MNADFIGGSRIKNFENEFAQYIETKHCIGCANGTDAIEIALQSIGIFQVMKLLFLLIRGYLQLKQYQTLVLFRYL